MLQVASSLLRDISLKMTSLAAISAVSAITAQAAIANPLSHQVQQSQQPQRIAQAPPPSADFITLCSYDPTAGVPNPLGMRTFLSIREIEGNSIFRYQQLPAIVSGANIPTASPASIEQERTLTLYETPIAEARQRVLDNPAYYASLIGVSVSDLGSIGFAEVNATLSCQYVSSNIAGTPAPRTAAPRTATPRRQTPRRQTPSLSQSAPPTLAALPNGNYRMASAEFTNRVVSDAELLANGGYLFTFRKFGDQVTGSFSHIAHEESACVTGIVSGNLITGEAYTASEPTLIGGKTYLDPLGVLLLGDPVTSGERYNNSVMNVEGLFPINAGARIPTESCP